MRGKGDAPPLQQRGAISPNHYQPHSCIDTSTKNDSSRERWRRTLSLGTLATVKVNSKHEALIISLTRLPHEKGLPPFPCHHI